MRSERPAFQWNKLFAAVGFIASLCTIIGLGFFLYDRYKAKPLTIAQRYQVALQYFNEHNHLQAAMEAKQLLLEQPTHKESHELLASCYMEDGNLSAAATECQEAIRIDPNDVVAKMALATALKGLGDYTKAREIYRGVIVHPLSSASQRIEARTWLARLGN